jgi:SAM-dependent methyltransferase
MEDTPNIEFILTQVGARCGPHARVLDFGCGAGLLVARGRAEGFDIVGADPFGETVETLRDHRQAGRMGRTIFVILDGRLPFADTSFDAVIANQVLEHVHNLPLALAEISRVLRPGGIFLALNPTLGVLREGHCGIPLAQLLQRVPRLQHAYLLLARLIGLGLWTRGRGRREWARSFARYMQEQTVYRRARELILQQAEAIGPTERIEPALATHRLAAWPALARLARYRWLQPAIGAAVTHFGNMVTIATKPAVSPVTPLRDQGAETGHQRLHFQER